MGCDIHAFLEVKHYKYNDKERKNGIWVNADKWTRNEDVVLYPEDYGRKYEVKYEDRIYACRNYLLFAILANVRNHWDIKPISKPKGVPEDVTEEVKRECEYWDCDGHSHSYLTLTELLNFDQWDTPDEDVDYAFCKEEVKELEEKYGDKHIRTVYENDFVFKVYYKTYWRELCSEFMKTLERMKSYLKEGRTTTDDIRLVFWFDN